MHQWFSLLLYFSLCNLYLHYSNEVLYFLGLFVSSIVHTLYLRSVGPLSNKTSECLCRTSGGLDSEATLNPEHSFSREQPNDVSVICTVVQKQWHCFIGLTHSPSLELASCAPLFIFAPRMCVCVSRGRFHPAHYELLLTRAKASRQSFLQRAWASLWSQS